MAKMQQIVKDAIRDGMSAFHSGASVVVEPGMNSNVFYITCTLTDGNVLGPYECEITELTSDIVRWQTCPKLTAHIHFSRPLTPTLSQA